MVFFINAVSLHSCVPFGRFFHFAKATFHQPPQHDKQECSFIPIHKAWHSFSCLGRCIPALIFCVELRYKKQPTLQCIFTSHFKHQHYFVHFIQSHTCPVVHNLNFLLRETKYACGSFFHSDAFRFRRSYLTILPLHCIFIPSATSPRKASVWLIP